MAKHNMKLDYTYGINLVCDCGHKEKLGFCPSVDRVADRVRLHKARLERWKCNKCGSSSERKDTIVPRQCPFCRSKGVQQADGNEVTNIFKA
jgi:predicted Zn-ribbon and HTH transcriptional regulator